MQLRNSLLLLLSMILIAAFNPESLAAVVIFSLITFFLARAVQQSRALYLAGVTVNIIAIFFFNYFQMQHGHLHLSFQAAGFSMNKFIVALGLSFYALQNISYLTEVRSGRFTAVTKIQDYLLYNCYFPRIISGPVMFPEEFFPLLEKGSYSRKNLALGGNRILLGLFKKLVIADNLAPSVASVFDFGSPYSAITTFAGGCLFTIQLYFDFSGYTDIALGAAEIMGIPLKENFNLPLWSTSVTAFWRRWHISLISWFTRYIYYPVVFRFRHAKKIAAVIGIMITFLVSGLWHGLAITFLLWAAVHATAVCIELLLKYRIGSTLGKIRSGVAVLYVFLVVSFSNIFFRSVSWNALKNEIGAANRDFFPNELMKDFFAPLAVGGHQMEQFNFLVIMLIATGFLFFERRIFEVVVAERFRVIPVTMLILFIVLFGVFSNSSRFIYMQF